ncbi:MAG: type II toxin-antitoxin system Phd/YefM family antitoxin [Caldisericota bacterium]|nr:type II toxin-antitoxin system Phd/YefM family antitoxin [Caldisericota bacterium]
MLKAINATEGKKKFLELLDSCKEQPFLIIRKGKPTAVLMDSGLYESIMETIKFYAYPEIAKEIKEWKKR